MYGDGCGGIPWEEDEGGGGGRGRDNGDNDTDGAGASDLLPPQMPSPAINVRGTGSCLIHDFLGIAGSKQLLAVPRLVDDDKDKEELLAPQ